MNLENLNLVELNAQEMKITEGGYWWAFLAAAAWSAWDNAGDFPDGFNAGYNAAHP